MIRVHYSSIDHYGETRQFKTLAGARRYAHKYVGAHPEIGSHYAISGDGVGKITVDGCALTDLFPTQDGRKTVEYFTVTVPGAGACIEYGVYADDVEWYWTIAPHPVLGGPFRTKDEAQSDVARARVCGEI